MSTDIQLLTLLQEYTRYNQSSLLEYLFLADLKHKAIGKALNSKVGVEELKEKVADLNNYFETQFSDITKRTCGYLRTYFTKEYCSQRSEMMMRVAIKVIVDDRIVSLERFPQGVYEDFESRASENSAFESLVGAGQKNYYFCNSIPNAVRDNSYKNNRIDIQKARQYVRSEAYQKARENLITPEEAARDWVNCWKRVTLLSGKKLRPPTKSCYKSTLVLPISVNLKDLKSASFKDYFYINEENRSDNDRIMFGYVCLDHPLEGYFLEETDVNITDIFARFLSFYMLPQVAYTQYSTSYFRALKAIGESSKKSNH